MTDLTQTLAALIQPICAVSLQFPDAGAKFPIATLSQLGNESAVALAGQERISLQDWQVDVFDSGTTPQTAAALAAQISAALVAVGMQRYFGQRLDDASGIWRYTMRFRGYLDEQTNRIYEGV